MLTYRSCAEALRAVGASTAFVARGNIYLPREIYDACLAGIDAVALLALFDEVLIVPLTAESGGGLLLKVRNARGDRVIHAQEFFRREGFSETFDERVVSIQWSPERAALVLSNIARR